MTSDAKPDLALQKDLASAADKEAQPLFPPSFPGQKRFQHPKYGLLLQSVRQEQMSERDGKITV